MTVSPSLAEVIALLPCPFCGCKPELFRGRNRSRVACTTKRCKVQPVGLSVHPFTKAIAAWNGRRAAPEAGDNRAAFINGYMECAHRHVMASTPISAIEHHARIAADAAGYEATRTSAASLRDEEWLPIDSAPDVGGDCFWCRLAWGPEDDQSTGDGFRWNGKWFAAGCFYQLGQDRKYAWREIEVKPTHWMPKSQTPPATQPAAQERQA